MASAIVGGFAGILLSPAGQGAPGAPGPKGDPGSGVVDLTYIADTVISGETALEFRADGYVAPANPVCSHAWVYAGIALAAAQPGQPVTVRYVGDITAAWWTWAFGLPVFVAPAGALTQQPPIAGWSRTVGFATSATTIRLVDEGVIFLEN